MAECDHAVAVPLTDRTGRAYVVRCVCGVVWRARAEMPAAVALRLDARLGAAWEPFAVHPHPKIIRRGGRRL